MAIPDRDVGPSWLSDYGAIEAHIQRMEQFAAELRAEVTKNYVPHLELVAQDMTAAIQQPDPRFGELDGFVKAHVAAQMNTTNAIMYHGDETDGFAEAAAKISEHYGASDAFAKARVSGVEHALDSSTTVLPDSKSLAGAPVTSPGSSDA